MKHLLGAATVFLALLGGNRASSGQSTTISPVAAQSASQAKASGQKDAPGAPVVAQRPTDKQLALQAQTDRLVALATELKDQVDKTNKNILSLKVVKKAEEIEQFAKRLKEQNRK